VLARAARAQTVPGPPTTVIFPPLCPNRAGDYYYRRACRSRSVATHGLLVASVVRSVTTRDRARGPKWTVAAVPLRTPSSRCNRYVGPFVRSKYRSRRDVQRIRRLARPSVRSRVRRRTKSAAIFPFRRSSTTSPITYGRYRPVPSQTPTRVWRRVNKQINRSTGCCDGGLSFVTIDERVTQRRREPRGYVQGVRNTNVRSTFKRLRKGKRKETRRDFGITTTVALQ